MCSGCGKCVSLRWWLAEFGSVLPEGRAFYEDSESYTSDIVVGGGFSVVVVVSRWFRRLCSVLITASTSNEKEVVIRDSGEVSDYDPGGDLQP